MTSTSLRFTGVALVALAAAACGSRSASADNVQANCNKSKLNM